jgi:uncharacterized protein YjbI with pentapeptide repeats
MTEFRWHEHSKKRHDMIRLLVVSSSLLYTGLLFAGPYQFDFSRKVCMNEAGALGRNSEPGVCGDQQGLDLAGASLSGRRLTGSDYALASLTKASLENASLEYSLFQSASLDGANLSLSKLMGVKAENANFDRAILEEADAREAEFKGASFVDARLNYVIANSSKVDQAHFQRAQIRSARFRSASMVATDWRDVEGEAADFSQTIGSQADFTGAHLNLAIFRGATLINAKFNNADLYQADFRGSNLKGADLRGLRAEEALFSGAKFDSGTYLPFSKAQAESLGMVFDSSPSDAGARPQLSEKSLVTFDISNRKITLWENGGLSTTMPLQIPAGRSFSDFYRYTMSKSGEKLALCLNPSQSDQSSLIIIQNLMTQVTERLIWLDHDDGCSGLAWSPDGKNLAAVQPAWTNALRWVDVFSIETGMSVAQRRFTDKSVDGKVHFLNSTQLFYTTIPSDKDGISQGTVETASIYDLASKSEFSPFQLPNEHYGCWLARYENSLPTCYASRSNNITRLDSNGSRNINFYQYVNGGYLYYFVRELLPVPGSNQLVAVLEDTSRSGEDGDFSVQLIPADLSGQGRPLVQGMRSIKNLSLSSDGKKMSFSRYARVEDSIYRDKEQNIYDLNTGVREYGNAWKGETAFTSEWTAARN